MSVKALQDYTFVSRYARYIPEMKRRETWEEAIDRVAEMHLAKYADKGVEEEIRNAMDMVKQSRVLGSQRALQFGGEAMMKHNSRGYNCTVSYADRPRFFQETMYLLLCGCGVGFSVQRPHVSKLPGLVFGHEDFDSLDFKDHIEAKKFVIPDSIEGWSDAVGVLISSFMDGDVPFPEYQGKKVQFDFSQIRPKGSSFSHGIGKAPGPDGLRSTLQKIEWLLISLCDLDQKRLKPINVYDIVMHISDAVLSGGVRRSATICIFSADDLEMANAKTGNWFQENPQRGRSNNSALLLRGSTTREEFDKLIESTRTFGEPGFLWADDVDFLANPCVEIGFYAYDEFGNSGWHFCNLTEINGKKIKTEEDFYRACEASAILGTIQAGYTSFPYLGEVTERIVKREALLGCSITGVMDSPDILTDPKILRRGAKIILETNEEMAAKIGINPAARATCVKPAGTTSSILGTSSGIHPHHAKRYLRRVQANKVDPVLDHFKKTNPDAVEESVWSNNGTDDVITFCIEVPDGSKLKNQLSAIEMLEVVKTLKKNWVDYGRVEDRCVKPWLSHNVSNTISVKEDEWEAVATHIFRNRASYAGVSLLPISGDKDYPQAPFTTVYTPAEQVKMHGDAQPFASGIIELALQAFDGNLWEACDVLLGIKHLKQIPTFQSIEDVAFMREQHEKRAIQLAFITRARRFADKYFDSDYRKMTYCLKDVYSWKTWVDLNRTYKNVDYTTLIEDQDNTNHQEELACAGGACEIAL